MDNVYGDKGSRSVKLITHLYLVQKFKTACSFSHYYPIRPHRIVLDVFSFYVSTALWILAALSVSYSVHCW
jgi:hypothetical protein